MSNLVVKTVFLYLTYLSYPYKKGLVNRRLTNSLLNIYYVSGRIKGGYALKVECGVELDNKKIYLEMNYEK